MEHLGLHTSYRRYRDRTILIDHQIQTTYELNDTAGETLDRIERGEEPLPDEQDFVNGLRTLGILDTATRRMTETGDLTDGTPSAGEGIFAELKCYGEKHCIPVSATFSITYRCSLTCRHCFLDQKPATADGELTLHEIEDVLDQLRDAGTLYLTFTGGEPFLRNDLLDIVAAARKRRFAVSLLTSGYFCDEPILDKLAALWPESVQVSLYGPNGAIHDAFTGVPGSFERAMRTLRGLRNRGIAVTAAVSLNTLTAPTVRELARLLRSEQIPVSYNLTMLPARNGTTRPEALNLPEENLSSLIRDLAIPPNRRLAEKSPGAPPCGAARSVVAIDPYGTVFPCHEIDLPAGSLREKRFTDLWHVLPFENLRKIRFADLADCPACPHRTFCGRCPALALRMGGRIVDHAELDCRIAQAFTAVYSSH